MRCANGARVEGVNDIRVRQLADELDLALEASDHQLRRAGLLHRRTILQGNGGGTFHQLARYTFAQPINGGLFAGDFNGDGKTDLFLPGNSGS
jgi:hypothetical protein